jgi:hypothetical protein
MTTSPRSSGRQYRPSSNSAPGRKPRTSRSRSAASNGVAGGLVLHQLDAQK